ncbi:MAG: hypothetical protein IKA41_00585 [Bacteroidaceae bacterium]|nr:hypothetical protein [Bacteroidaceae bacterium]
MKQEVEAQMDVLLTNYLLSFFFIYAEAVWLIDADYLESVFALDCFH